MAYTRKYFLEFTNVQQDVIHIFILEKDYEGNIYGLRGEGNASFTTNYLSGDAGIFTPIRAKECTLNFTAENGISLLNFYSEDDEQFRIDHFVHSINGVIVDKFIASYFLVQDNCEQEFTAEPFGVTLRGTDNIALLKDVPFNTTGMPYNPDDGSVYFGKISLFDYFHIAILSTGLSEMPFRIYNNLFENTTQDRTDTVTAEMLQQTMVFTGDYQDENGEWKDIYSIIEQICTRFMFIFCQDNGAWNIVRRQESYLFTDNKIQGVEHDLITGDKTAIELDYNWPLAFVPITTNHIDKRFLDKANHISRIQRPYKFTQETFNYNQPASLIQNVNFDLPDGAIPFETETVGDFRYDKYSISTYFPYWIQTHGDTSYLIVVTDIINDAESDRFIVTPGANNEQRGIQFNPIPVSKGDVIDFSLRYRTDTDTDDTLRFW